MAMYQDLFQPFAFSSPNPNPNSNPIEQPVKASQGDEGEVPSPTSVNNFQIRCVLAILYEGVFLGPSVGHLQNKVTLHHDRTSDDFFPLCATSEKENCETESDMKTHIFLPLFTLKYLPIDPEAFLGECERRKLTLAWNGFNGLEVNA